MPRVLLAGAFGQHNPGDEALLAAFLEHLPAWDVVATSRDPRATRSLHGCDALHPNDRVAIGRELARVDAVVVGGGTIFKRLAPDTGRAPHALLATSLALAIASRTRGIPFALVGVGAGHLDGRAARWLARSIVRLSTMVILRDEESAEVLAAAGAPSPFRVGADAAWVLWSDEPPGSRAGREHGPVVVAISRHAITGGLTIREFASSLAAGLLPLVEAGVPLELQPWQVDDIPLARETLGRLPRRTARIVAPPATLREARIEFTTARAVVGLRFHALVAAAAAGTPFVAYAHEPKLAALSRRFDQPAIRTLDELPALCAAVDAAIARPPAHSVARAETAKAEETFRLLHLLLSGGDDDDLATLAGLTLAEGVPSP